MELRQLEAFVTVAEERNFTRAAARLYVAQSGLSATIRSLERELGSQLFVRSTRRVDLSPAGAALLPEARRTLGSARAASDAVAAIEGLQRGTITLGIMQSVWLFHLPDLLARYRATYPGVRIKLQHNSSIELVHLLRESALDLTFATAFYESYPDLLSVPLFRSPMVAVCTREDALSQEDGIRLEALTGREQIGFPLGWGVRTLTDNALRSVGMDPSVDLEVNDTNTLLDLVEAGLGVALIPEAIAKLRPSLHRMTILDGNWYWTIAAQALAPAPVNPAARALWTMLTADELPR